MVDTIPTEGGSFLSAGVISLTTNSTGRLRLASADWKAHPIVEPSCLATEVDVGIAVEGGLDRDDFGLCLLWFSP